MNQVCYEILYSEDNSHALASTIASCAEDNVEIKASEF